LLRFVAVRVLLIGVFQIAMCAADCDCFLPAAARMSPHSASRADADGCLCCAQSAEVHISIEIPSPLPKNVPLPGFALEAPRHYAAIFDRPPRA
jgi:hypothetical protein